MGVAPSSDWILEDILRVIHSLKLVHADEGCMIDENNRDGRRFEKNEKQVENGCGGSRTKASQDEYSHKLATSSKAKQSDADI